MINNDKIDIQAKNTYCQILGAPVKDNTPAAKAPRAKQVKKNIEAVESSKIIKTKTAISHEIHNIIRLLIVEIINGIAITPAVSLRAAGVLLMKLILYF
jgi:hypothetical protein